MADYGTVVFHGTPNSGVLISQLGSGTYDHIGFFGPNDLTSGVEISNYQDTTWIIDLDGATFPGLPSGKLVNCKYIDANTVRISGLPDGPYEVPINQVNVFNPAALATEPQFPNQASGTLLIEYQASGTSTVHTYNAKIYGYSIAGGITVAPPDVTVVGFEVNASGLWYSGQSGVWVSMNGSTSPLYLVDHKASLGWRAANKHLWTIGISAKPNSIGILDDWNLAFQMQFA